jgi:hypothetical protein
VRTPAIGCVSEIPATLVRTSHPVAPWLALFPVTCPSTTFSAGWPLASACPLRALCHIAPRHWPVPRQPHHAARTKESQQCLTRSARSPNQHRPTQPHGMSNVSCSSRATGHSQWHPPPAPVCHAFPTTILPRESTHIRSHASYLKPPVTRCLFPQ